MDMYGRTTIPVEDIEARRKAAVRRHEDVSFLRDIGRLLMKDELNTFRGKLDAARKLGDIASRMERRYQS